MRLNEEGVRPPAFSGPDGHARSRHQDRGEHLTAVTNRPFVSTARLAAFSGLALVTRRSGCSIRSEYSSRRGNKILKRRLFLLAFATLRDPVSPT